MKIDDRNFRAYLDLTGVGGPLKDSGLDLEDGVVTACRFCPDDLDVLLDVVREQGRQDLLLEQQRSIGPYTPHKIGDVVEVMGCRFVLQKLDYYGRTGAATLEVQQVFAVTRVDLKGGRP